MTAIIGIDLTQDGSQIISEVYMNYFTQSEQEKLIELMLWEHDQVFINDVDPNNCLLLNILASAKEIIK